MVIMVYLPRGGLCVEVGMEESRRAVKLLRVETGNGGNL
jgi:hypothetical protein